MALSALDFTHNKTTCNYTPYLQHAYLNRLLEIEQLTVDTFFLYLLFNITVPIKYNNLEYICQLQMNYKENESIIVE